MYVSGKSVRRSCAVLLSLLICGCHAAEPAPSPTPTASPTPAAILQAKVAVLARLRDPGSATFGDSNVNDQGNVCGTVNAKNTFGAYMGAKAFWFDPKTGEAYIARDGDWGDKGADAAIFQRKGCSIGPDQAKALDVHRRLSR